MKLAPKYRKAAGYGLTAIIGGIAGVWLPPEVMGNVVAGVAGLF